MRIVDIIEKKKNNQILSKEEIQFWIDGVVDNTVEDYQSSALLMAIVLNGMNAEETANLTNAMLNSGEIYDLSSIQGIKVDKHSTGGVGDKTSLVLGPMVAACGAKVAKMSGRGLGHTGGTLDKLESITNFNINLSKEQFIAQVNAIGLSIIGQTAHTAPADKSLYALRDVTATIDSLPLIASSIMSKKLSSGADTILLDVKFGDGAFMDTPEQAEELANSMISIGKNLNKSVNAIITNMNQPLGHAIGNALEVKEAIDTLQGNGPMDFTRLCLKCGAIMLLQAGIVKDEDEGYHKLIDVIADGSALAKLREMVAAQGGDVRQIDNPDLLPKAQYITTFNAGKTGYVANLKAENLGILAMELGAGRQTVQESIDHAVGLVVPVKVGSKVEPDSILVEVHHSKPLSANWIKSLASSIVVSEEYVEELPLIHKVL